MIYIYIIVILDAICERVNRIVWNVLNVVNVNSFGEFGMVVMDLGEI